MLQLTVNGDLADRLTKAHTAWPTYTENPGSNVHLALTRSESGRCAVKWHAAAAAMQVTRRRKAKQVLRRRTALYGQIDHMTDAQLAAVCVCVCRGFVDSIA